MKIINTYTMNFCMYNLKIIMTKYILMTKKRITILDSELSEIFFYFTIMLIILL